MQTQKRDAPMGTGGGKFLKLEVGQSVNGVFRGEIISYWQKWPKGGVKVTSDVPLPDFQERFKVNFVVHEEGEFTAKIFDLNLFTYNQIATINESMDIESIKCTISRQATGKGSTYFVMPNLKEPLKPAALKAIAAVELIPIGPASAPSQSAPANGDSSDIPF